MTRDNHKSGISSKNEYIIGQLKSLHEDINVPDAILAIEVTTKEIFDDLETAFPNIKRLVAYDKIKRKWLER